MILTKYQENPVREEGYKKFKKTVILDLDETLINSTEKSKFNFVKNADKMIDPRTRCEDMDGYYLVFERPNLQEFLDYLFDNFNVSVWTAATKDYAIFIVKKFIQTKENMDIDFLLFKNHCEYCKEKNGGMKDLDILWDDYKLPGYSKENTIIIDDYDRVYKSNTSTKKKKINNCYKIKPFLFSKKISLEDNELPILKEYLEEWK